MATLQITDQFALSYNIELADDSPLAKAGIFHLACLDHALKDEFTKPLDQRSLREFSFGVQASTPSVSLGSATLNAGGGACGKVRIIRSSETNLFPGDNFAPKIPISSDQCWIGLSLELSVNAGAQAGADGFGISFEESNMLGLTTYKLIEAQAGRFPTLLDGLRTTLDGIYLASTPGALRGLPPGTVCANELSGAVTFTGYYQIPVSVNPLASADLPFNYTIAVQPQATVELSGSIALCGDLILRAYKVDASTLKLGIYKKKGSTLTAGFTAGGGMEVEHGTSDLAAALLSVAFPRVNVEASGITGGNAEALNAALKGCIDRSLAISMNISCSAAVTNEAAVVYRIALDSGDAAQTSAALRSALGGDWTLLSQLPNAQRFRNIVTDSKEYQHSLALNLFGILNAASIDGYLQSSTILCDEFGHISVINQSDSGRIRVAAVPYAADPNKLRAALAQDFLVTATYAVVGSEVSPAFTAKQTYLFYDVKASRQEMRDQVLLGEALGLIGASDKSFWDTLLAASSTFPHAYVSAAAQYGNRDLLSLFLGSGGQPRSPIELEQAGRTAMIALLDPDDPYAQERLAVLRDDAAWNAMDSTGNVGAFRTIPALRQLPANALADVAADWTAVRWWADTMLRVAPQLASLLAFVRTVSADGFSTNPEFLKRTRQFQNILGALVKKTHAAFVGGWGMALVSSLAGPDAVRSMSISWGSSRKHYGSGSGSDAGAAGQSAPPLVLTASQPVSGAIMEEGPAVS